MVASNTAVNKPAAKKVTRKATSGERKAAKGASEAESKAAGGDEGGQEKDRAKAEKGEEKGGTGSRPAKRAPARKAAARKETARKETARKTGAKNVAAKKSRTKATATGVPPARVAGPVAPGELAVRAGEEPWTAEEVAEARAKLAREVDRLRSEIASAEEAITGLMRDSGDGAGDDQADTGSKNVTREHELALAGNAREVLYQTERALAGIEAGTYGLCESCGNPVGKARMQAFPRATLCVDCKQRQERRF